MKNVWMKKGSRREKAELTCGGFSLEWRLGFGLYEECVHEEGFKEREKAELTGGGLQPRLKLRDWNI
jgi:hypothetical protein